MTYEEALQYIHSIMRFGSKPGLEHITELCRELGDPQKRLRFVHVAGTNGKGSTSAMTASILRRAGYSTGLYISPYVEDFRERIQLDGEWISKDDLADCTETVRRASDVVNARGVGDITEFEFITAVAFVYYFRKKADFVVLEVGMGGRLDATNVISVPELAIIAKIGLDHCAILGDTVEKIAFEKAGIIKNGGKVAIYPYQPGEVTAELYHLCEERGARLRIPDITALRIISMDGDGSRFNYQGVDYELNMPGEHLIYNALTAIEGALELSKKWEITGKDICDGIAATRFGGRLEHIGTSPDRYIDAAHNPDCVDAIARAIDTIFTGRPLVAVMGMFKDKDYNYCIPLVASRAARFIAVTPPGERGLDKSVTASVARESCADTLEAENLSDAARLALDKAKELENPVVIALGSLSFIGEAKKELMRNG